MRNAILVGVVSALFRLTLLASQPLAVDTPLEEAVARFNAEAQSDPTGKTQTPLTVDEIVAAIRTWSRNDQPRMNDAHYAAFQKIADTRVLPAGSYLDKITGWSGRNGYDFDVWWVDLFLSQNPSSPDPAIGLGYNFRIRDVKIRCRPAAQVQAVKQERPAPAKNDIVTGIDFPDAPLKDVLKFYGFLSKQLVLAHIDLDLEIWVDIVKKEQMTVFEAKTLIRETLLKRHHLEVRESGSGEILVTRVVEPRSVTRSKSQK